MSLSDSLPDIIMCMGFPGSGKSSYIEKHFPDALIISNDRSKTAFVDYTTGLHGEKLIVIDNTNLVKSSRKKFLDLAKKENKTVQMLYFPSTIEDCQIRVLHRQWQKFGRLFLTGNSTKHDIPDSHIFPIAALFKSRLNMELPEVEEGFSNIKTVSIPSPLSMFSDYPNRALFLDIDGTLRKTDHLPNKYPTDPSQIILLKDAHRMRAKIESYREQGYRLVGVSNQSGINRGTITEEICRACMDRTLELLGVSIEIFWCPHKTTPISCYCRKPQSGMGMHIIETYKVNPTQSIMVGDQTSDQTFAERLGMKFIHADSFFKDC